MPLARATLPLRRGQGEDFPPSEGAGGGFSPFGGGRGRIFPLRRGQGEDFPNEEYMVWSF